MIGKPIFDYPPERKAPDGEGCIVCGIVLEADAIDGQHCSPECYEWPDRCQACQRGLTWCDCECTHCIECGEPLSERAQEARHRVCSVCVETQVQKRPVRTKEIT